MIRFLLGFVRCVLARPLRSIHRHTLVKEVTNSGRYTGSIDIAFSYSVSRLDFVHRIKQMSLRFSSIVEHLDVSLITN